MDISFLEFGKIKIKEKVFEHDIIINRGRVRIRNKKASKRFRKDYGHTPVSCGESLPWGGDRLIIGTGAYGQLPVMEEVLEESQKRGVHVESMPTEQACDLIAKLLNKNVYALLHVTC